MSINRPNPSRRTRQQRPSRAQRNSRRNQRDSLFDTICAANQRAKKRALISSNRRIKHTPMSRSMYAAAVTDSYDDGYPQAGLIPRIGRWLLALMLLPACIVTTMALFNITEPDLTASKTYWMDLVKTRHFLFFSVGIFLMCGWFFTGLFRMKFLYLYVLGHELTHAIFVYLCGGKVSNIQVSRDGGYIITNKTNTLIALSPYFVPFWSVVVLILSLTIDLLQINLPHHREILYLGVGASWGFHLLWTLWMIPRDQPDLQENGVFFSLVIIYLANVFILSILPFLAPGNLTWHHWVNQFLDSGLQFQHIISKILETF